MNCLFRFLFMRSLINLGFTVVWIIHFTFDSCVALFFHGLHLSSHVTHHLKKSCHTWFESVTSHMTSKSHFTHDLKESFHTSFERVLSHVIWRIHVTHPLKKVMSRIVWKKSCHASFERLVSQDVMSHLIWRSHVTPHMKESCHTSYEGVMSHVIWRSHVKHHMKESCETSYEKESCYSCQEVMWMSRLLKCEWVMSHMWMN